jgi:hypothetical protein
LKATASLLALAFLLSGCAAESGDAEESDPVSFELRGVVVDDAIRPLAGAAVTLDGALRNVTGPDGAFSFSDVAAGSHQVGVEAAGYSPAQAVAVAGPDALPIRIILNPVPVPGGFHQTFAFDGFFQAGTGLASMLVDRVEDNLGNGTACSCSFIVDAADVVRAFVLEAVWEDNVPRPDGPTAYRWHISTPEPPQTISAYDPSPVRVEVNGAAFDASLRQFEVGLEPDAVWPAVQQEFQLAVSLFYGQAPPADFAVLV